MLPSKHLIRGSGRKDLELRAGPGFGAQTISSIAYFRGICVASGGAFADPDIKLNGKE